MAGPASCPIRTNEEQWVHRDNGFFALYLHAGPTAWADALQMMTWRGNHQIETPASTSTTAEFRKSSPVMSFLVSYKHTKFESSATVDKKLFEGRIYPCKVTCIWSHDIELFNFSLHLFPIFEPMVNDIYRYCRDRVSSRNIYAVQQDTQSVLMSEFIQHLC